MEPDPSINGLYAELFNLTQFGVPLLLILLGLIVGRTVERRHLARLDERERELGEMLVTDVRTYAAGVVPAKSAELVMGQVVIATDYLKTFLAGLRKILGGRVRSYETLLERARREAIVRMLDEARRRGYNAVCNLRIDTADIGGMAGARGAAMAAAFVSGTAYRLEPSAVSRQRSAPGEEGANPAADG